MFYLCSQELMLAALLQAYVDCGSRASGECFSFWGEADMPAYIHHHEFEPAFIICPSCVGMPMFVRDVEPHWTMAKIDFTFECSDCGAEIRKTVIRPEPRH